MTQITVTMVVDALRRMAGMNFTPAQIPLLQPLGNRIRTAIQANDGEGLAAYAALAVGTALKEAGYNGVLTPTGLRTYLETEGWAVITDVLAKRENAAMVLKGKLDAIQGGSQFAGQSSHPQDPRPPQTASQAPQRGQAPPQQQTRSAAAPPQAGRMAQQSEPARSAGSPQGNSAPQQPQRPTTLQGPAPQRHSNENVRTIGSAPTQRAQQGGDRARGDGAERGYDQVKVHGGKAALTIEADISRREEPTIRIEAAKKTGVDARGNNVYDWTKKIAIQLTTAELQHCTALFHGQIQQVKFQNHGQQQDKWFEIVRQVGEYAGTYKVVIGQGSDMCLVQITSADIGNVSSLFRRQCALQMRESLTSLESALRPVSDAYNAVQARRGSAGGTGGGAGNGGQRGNGAGNGGASSGSYAQRRA